MQRAIIIPLVAFTCASASVAHSAEYKLDCSVSGTRQKGEAVAVQLESNNWIIRFEQPLLFPSEMLKTAFLSVPQSVTDAGTVKIDLAAWRQSVRRDGTLNFHAIWNASSGQSFPVSRVTVDRLEDGRFALKAYHNDFATCPHGPPPGAPYGECDSTQYIYSGVCELEPEATS